MAHLIQSAIDQLDGIVKGLEVKDASEVTSTAGGAAAPSASASTPNLRSELRVAFTAAIKDAFPDAAEAAQIAPCAQPKFGDYQCNNAMGLFGRLKGSPGAPKAPRAVAEAILARLPPHPMIAGTSLAGPGFINVKLDTAWLGEHVREMVVRGAASWAPTLKKRVVVDFSSPNVAKEMHVGHLRSTIIGDTICRALEFCGADVLRLNHVGDWGTQFGMLIQFMRESGDGDGAEERVSDLQKLYKQSKVRFDEDEGFKNRAREAVTKLQSGDPESLEKWKRICAASRIEFEAIYQRLGVTVQERGESFYNPMLHDVLKELTDLGIVEDSDGAKVVWIDREKLPPLMMQKSDGGFGYASTDMAALQHRLRAERADWIIYVTDAGQAGHFDLVFKAAKRAGWLQEGGARVDHVAFGLVLGEDGKRFRTRSSEVVKLVDLLDEARDKCKESLIERRKEANEAVDEAEVSHAAAAMGYGAVKYADLKNSRLTDYKFSFDNMLSLKGNTAVYLLYAHARIAGIVRKSGKDVNAMAQSGKITLGHEAEVALAIHLSRFPEAIEDMLADLLPNRITDYLYTLSEVFNSFYTECKVIGSAEEESRLLLVEATGVIMRACFALLGITPLYKI